MATVGGLGSSGGNAHLPTHQSHVFDLAGARPGKYDGGRLRHGNEETFPLLTGQDVSAVLVQLDPGGLREPHWHPSAWEIHYVLSGSARFAVLETGGYHEDFVASAGQLVFLPMGGFHYFENASSTEEYTALLVFNTSAPEPKDDIGVVAALGVLPPHALASVLGVAEDVVDRLPRATEPVTIVRRDRPSGRSDGAPSRTRRLPRLLRRR